MPQVIFYDNACNLHLHIQTSTEDAYAFRNTVLPVNAFHIKSHKDTHTSCCANNHPNLFPQLKRSDGSWRFNSSAAEIVNAWFCRFDSMCRNMHQVKYNFFLDEMIRLHNVRTCAKLSSCSNVDFIGNIRYKTESPQP
ncbi:uncharacterized protein MELLADRAFT_70900 [Melampsora larici-populina 98AG31]|uniref:CxC6 like cysteine cluster associated with KDZ domain-containing protein n=1 Tax=Melampsora larici-populina (strain 98AG31 / pathotype 3-4-7) TaxID=747676 RepID=F4R992_MELLP|nr:uncharacterized protein MELLADRAFT_70900 [Melampsora larici-populina 98AG31]EGG11194.1 hypothetical protein MELLADRAFT_70900 [Melampsora larici-populina 98AG31]